MKIRKTVPSKDNKYYLTDEYGGYSPCILGNPENRYCTGSVLANCVGGSVGRANEIYGKKKIALLGNMYPHSMLSKAKEQGLETGTKPRAGAILVWYSSDHKHEHVANVEKETATGFYIWESGWNFAKGKYCAYRHVTKLGNYGRQSNYTYRGCIYLPNVNPYKTPTDSKAIKKGAKGDKVKWMQWCLNYYGCYASKSNSNIDGSFGAKTETALKYFQKKYGLDPDGSCGAKTKAKIRELCTLED